jgi:hypothetical protein
VKTPAIVSQFYKITLQHKNEFIRIKNRFFLNGRQVLGLGERRSQFINRNRGSPFPLQTFEKHS